MKQLRKVIKGYIEETDWRELIEEIDSDKPIYKTIAAVRTSLAGYTNLKIMKVKIIAKAIRARSEGK